MTDEELNGFKAFMKRFQDKIIIPYVNGEVTEFVYKEGYSIASIYPKESYDLPCIVYHPKVAEDTSVSLRFTFIPNEILENFEDPTAFEVVEKLSPNSPEIGYFPFSMFSIVGATPLIQRSFIMLFLTISVE